MSPEWLDQRNCVGVDPELFFPERGASQVAAKAICNACVVREDCLEEFLGEHDGIFGGMNSRERRRLRVANARLYVIPGLPEHLEPERGEE